MTASRPHPRATTRRFRILRVFLRATTVATTVVALTAAEHARRPMPTQTHAGGGQSLATQTQPAGATALVAGQTVDGVTGAPVANTLIGLSQRTSSGTNTPASSAPLVLVMADEQGRFVVRDVPQGSFNLLATAPGYIVTNYGQGRPGGPTRTIDITSGERLVQLTVRLWRHAVISGTVTDEAGEPVVGATVRALVRRANGAGGDVRYGLGAETTTDDRGVYRLATLQPGQFLVSVPETQVTVPATIVDTFFQSVTSRGGSAASGRLLDLMNSGSVVPSAGGGVRVGDLLLQSSGYGRLVTTPPPSGGSVFVYPTVYYSTGESAGQTPIVLKSGEERTGVDIHLAPVRACRLSGLVTVEGEGAPNVSVRLVPTGGQILQNELGFESAATVTAADGSFTLLGVTPGRYLLKAVRTPRTSLPPALASNPAIASAYGASSTAAGVSAPSGPSSGALPLVGAQLPLQVGTSDVRDLVLSLRAGASVTGRVAFEGASTPTATQIHAMGVWLTSEDGGFPGAPIQIVQVSETGTFSVTAPSPGRYLLTPLRPPLGWRLSTVVAGGQTVIGPIDLSGRDVTDFTFGYTDKTAQLAGTVRTSTGTASPTAEIVLFSTDRHAWLQDPSNPRQPHLEQATNTGAFTMTGLLPGEYFAAAIDDVDVPEIADPSFLEAVAKFALRITLGPGEKKSQDLVVGRLK